MSKSETPTFNAANGVPPGTLAWIGVTPRQLAGFMAMVFGMFMAILDIQIVSASLSEIQAGLSASSDEIPWVQTAYLIAEVVMIPLSGFLARALSTRVLFLSAAIGFTAASALCATATSIDQMIVYRALQGFIGGGMIPSVFAVAFSLFPASKRNIVSPIIGLVATLAPTIGPTVGGYLSNAYSWHWLFLVNVGPGILVAIAVYFLVDFDKPNHSLLNRFDFAGLAGMAVMLGSLEYVLEEGPRYDWFDDQTIATFAVLTVLGAVLFFWRAATAREPIVELRAFRDRNFAFGSAFSFASGFKLDTGFVAAASIIVIEIVFAFLMRAPTVAGRKLMDQIDGFKMYLETAEKNRLNYQAKGEPPMTIPRFEGILPFAIALGVERLWSQRFEADLARNAVADAVGGHYSPIWYTGTDWSSSSSGFSNTVSSMATGMSAAMIAAQPSSSSGSGFSGGGGSGGGGGGGGGGGW